MYYTLDGMGSKRTKGGTLAGELRLPIRADRDGKLMIDLWVIPRSCVSRVGRPCAEVGMKAFFHLHVALPAGPSLPQWHPAAALDRPPHPVLRQLTGISH